MKEFSPFKVMLIIMLAMLIPMSMVIFGSTVTNMPYEHELISLDDNFTFTINGTTTSNVSFSDVNLSSLSMGDSATLTIELPPTVYQKACVSFFTSFYAVDVSIDGANVYSYGQDYLAQNKMLPDATHYIAVEDATKSHILTIVLTSTEKTKFKSLSEIIYGGRHDIYKKFMEFNRIPLFISVFLVLFSIMMLIMMPLLMIKKANDLSGLFSALISLCLGLYIFAYDGFLNILIGNSDLYVYLRYMPLYLIPFNAVGLYLYSIDKNSIDQFDNLLITVNLLFPVIAFILHITGVLHLCRLLSVSHIIILLSIIYIAYKLFTDIKLNLRLSSNPSTASSKFTLLLGVITIMLCSLIDMIRLYVRKYYLEIPNDPFAIVAVTYGSIILILCIIVNYFLHCMETINSLNIKEHLKGLAYSDALTGLANRARCEQVLAELSYSHAIYTIISLDLDHLKQVNDTLGHHEGDIFIQGFANMLKEVFATSYLIGRMGGDEFIVIFRGDHSDRCPDYFNKLQEMMNEHNNQESKFSYSASWGYAASRPEYTGSAKDIYMIADSNMYSMKQRHHSDTISRIYQAIQDSILEGGADNDKT